MYAAKLCNAGSKGRGPKAGWSYTFKAFRAIATHRGNILCPLGLALLHALAPLAGAAATAPGCTAPSHSGVCGLPPDRGVLGPGLGWYAFFCRAREVISCVSSRTTFWLAACDGCRYGGAGRVKAATEHFLGSGTAARNN